MKVKRLVTGELLKISLNGRYRRLNSDFIVIVTPNAGFSALNRSLTVYGCTVDIHDPEAFMSV